MQKIIINTLLKDQIYEYILHMIHSGEVEKGKKVPEQEICERLGVSRTPVREALTQLVTEGLVEQIPRRGFFIRDAKENEKKEMYIVRYTLELLAGELFMEIATPEMLEALEHIVDEMEFAFETKNFSEYVKADQKAHLYIVDNCGNSILANVVNSLLHFPIPNYTEISNEKEFDIFAEYITDHREIVRCLSKKDKKGLETVYRRQWSIL